MLPSLGAIRPYKMATEILGTARSRNCVIVVTDFGRRERFTARRRAFCGTVCVSFFCAVGACVDNLVTITTTSIVCCTLLHSAYGLFLCIAVTSTKNSFARRTWAGAKIITLVGLKLGLRGFVSISAKRYAPRWWHEFANQFRLSDIDDNSKWQAVY